MRFLIILTAFFHISQLSAATPKKVLPVLFFMGGFNSCEAAESVDAFSLGQGLATTKAIYQASKFQEKIVEGFFEKTGVQPVTFFSCYSNLLKNYRFDTFHLRHTFGDVGFSEFDFHAIQKNDLQSTEFLEPMFKAIQDELAELKKTYDLKVYVFGHSFGGFSAIHLTNYLQDSVDISGLVTIDPISPLSCSPRLIMFDLLRTAIGAHEGCSEYPSDDFSLAAISKIIKKNKIGWWVNVYQQQFRQLHSSSIPNFLNMGPEYFNLKSRRFKAEEVPGHPYKDFHSKLAVDELLWDELYEQRVLVTLVQ